MPSVVTIGIYRGLSAPRINIRRCGGSERIERLADDDASLFLDVKKTYIYKHLSKNDSLSRTDVPVLAYAHRRDGVTTMDESYGCDVTTVESIEVRGTAYLVVLLIKRV